MNQGYEVWLRKQGYDENTVSAQLYRASRVEEYYGDFDEHFEADGLDSIVAAFVYTSEDARQKRPNPTLIPYKGAVYGNMKGYKFCVRLYQRYRREMAPVEGDDLELIRDEPSLRVAPKPGRRSVSQSQFISVENPMTLQHFQLDGFAVLQALISSSRYKSLAQAMASLTLFSHPETVRQTGGKSIFRTIRGPRTPGIYSDENGQRVMLDDNKSASDAFKWVHGITGRLKDVQFNHIYTASKNVDAYTSLANICMTPAFVAKLTDDNNPKTSALLKYRAYDLYRWTPSGIEPPNKPEGYDELDWAPTLRAVADVKQALQVRMVSRPKDRTVLSTTEVGWLFGQPLSAFQKHDGTLK